MVAGSVVGWLLAWLVDQRLRAVVEPGARAPWCARWRGCWPPLLVAIVVVAAVVAVVADGFADARQRRVHAGWAVIAVLVGIVALAVVAFRRLDSKGGYGRSGSSHAVGICWRWASRCSVCLR